ncbi:hypothetical protein NQZ68_000317 [Dissostichus eleginoides]|nr:hypothetical protein NQZ68_000317 [Dissostichus eleginoides]
MAVSFLGVCWLTPLPHADVSDYDAGRRWKLSSAELQLTLAVLPSHTVSKCKNQLSVSVTPPSVCSSERNRSDSSAWKRAKSPSGVVSGEDAAGSQQEQVRSPKWRSRPQSRSDAQPPDHITCSKGKPFALMD